MKKIIAAFLLIALALGLCACGGNTDGGQNVSANTGTVSDGSEKYIGTWNCESDNHAPSSFRLMKNHKVIFQDWDAGISVTDFWQVNAGEWLLDEDRIVVFYTLEGRDEAWIFTIHEDGTLRQGEHIYQKAE